ncbi:efflux RND transporter periplasmic adaptor subunit [Aquabacterium sp. CECT 9606]|uniref:efflux RND transporter periplasmic adaptor subunit n=1 Tax=Aquabacterium sp. CECT 9606 TaxID=2845822 RepID=UPI001E4A1357|nr:efflux RND transporter periplasmic adaptor subunit [Aquabacterium sp. CECT 9606]CAH0352565.1 Efflux pump periplasmic linker BepF [Aquabacterium sp. CECT 9606]
MKTTFDSSLKRPAQAGFALAMLAALTMLLSGCGKEQDAHATPAGAPPAMPVSVAEVLSRPVAEQREFSGLIEAIDRAELRPRVSGYIDSVNLKPGMLVKKGDVLFVIDPRPYRAALAQAEAAVAGSQARAELAKTEQERSKKLLADNAIAQRDYDERTANVRQLDAAARADQAALQTARLNVEWTTIRAPFDGRVGKAEVTVGNLVDGNTVLTSVVSANPMYVSFNGDESTYLQLGKQARANPAAMKLHIGLANEKGFPHEGKLEFVDNRVDPVAGSVRMRGLVDNKDGLLTPGLFARVQVGTSSPTGAESALVAERAIGTDQNRKFVYVLNDKNMAEYRPIQLGTQVGTLRVVSSGLKAGERIVVDGLQRVRPGAPVAPQVVPMDGPAGGASGAAAGAQK